MRDEKEHLLPARMLFLRCNTCMHAWTMECHHCIYPAIFLMSIFCFCDIFIATDLQCIAFPHIMCCISVFLANCQRCVSCLFIIIILIFLCGENSYRIHFPYMQLSTPTR